MEIIRYSNQYFDKLIEFFRQNWAENHSIYDKLLFEWQYKGPYDIEAYGYLLIINNNVMGFVGGIPYRFIVDEKRLNGIGIAVWIVDKTIKNSGLGLYLRKSLEETSQIIYTIGLNLNVVKLYTSMGYTYFDALYRYIIPLNRNGYNKMLVEEFSLKHIGDWCDSIQLNSTILPLKDISTRMLSDKYYNNVKPYFRLLPDKDLKFWEWRYLKNEGFVYKFFEYNGNIVIARIESVYDKLDINKHGLKCLRLIEIIPNNGEVWNNKKDVELNYLLKGVLTWAKERGCILADFQISTAKIEHILFDIGFRKQEDLGVTNVVRLFAPLRNVNSLNFTYRVNVTGGLDIKRNDIYLLKSDCDMDRPNWLD